MTRYSVQPRDNLPKNNSETNEEEILRELYTSSEQKQKIIDDLRLIK